MENNKIQSSEDFNAKVHKVGRLAAIIIWTVFLLVPFTICFFFKLKINLLQLLSIALPISVMFGIVGLCENLSMAPIIGSGAIYVSSITGNISNMKLPAALNAMNLTNSGEGSEKGKIVSIIAVSTSAIVTSIIVFMGMVFLAPIVQPFLTNPNIKPAFDNMLPSLFGPLVIPIILKNPKQAIFPFGLAITLSLMLGNLYATFQSFILVAVILCTLAMYKIIFSKQSKS